MDGSPWAMVSLLKAIGSMDHEHTTKELTIDYYILGCGTVTIFEYPFLKIHSCP